MLSDAPAIAMRRPRGDAAAMALAPLDRFRAAVLADPQIQRELARHYDPAMLEAHALRWAEAQGIPLTLADLRAQTRPDPLGILDAPPSVGQWPPRHWLPARVRPDAGFALDWLHFADLALDAPFFEESRGQAAARPFNQMFRYRTSLDTLLSGVDGDSLAPDGFIFHMSRCGSTLAAQILAASPANIVVSEAAPIDAMIQLPFFVPGLTQDQHVAALRAIVAGYGRDRSGQSRRYFIKCDSWHVLALPLLLAAFPDTPWVFLHRDPVEVIVSQLRMRGAQAAPGVLPPHIFGFAADEHLAPVEYITRVLARICAAALSHADRGSALFVDYRDLPEAMFTRILPHFGTAPDSEELAQMHAAARRDAKAPGTVFTGDSAAKQSEASDEVRAAAGRHFAELTPRLQALSAS
jgi:sulfotransferase family protein